MRAQSSSSFRVRPRATATSKYVRRQRDEALFGRLEKAVRKHERRAAKQPLAQRPHDTFLYLELRRICGELGQ